MTGEKLFESIGGIDDRYIEEAAEENIEQAKVNNSEAESQAEKNAAESMNAGKIASGDSVCSENININIDEKSLGKADGIKSVMGKKARTSRLANIAACLVCLIFAASIGIFSIFENGAGEINENGYSFMKNGSYDYLFADGADQAAIMFSQFGEDSDGSDYKTSDSIAECPYEYSRSFDEKRKKLESEKKIPILEDYQKFFGTAAYLEDDSMYSVTLNWWSGSTSEQQSNIELMAAYHEIEDINCCVAEMRDENGNIIKPKETVVNGITIKSEGGNGLPRSLSFYKDGIWYRLSSADDSNDDLGKVLDWVWNNGIDFKNAFAAENGDKMEYDSFKAEGVEEYYNWRTVKSSEFYDEIPINFKVCMPKFNELGWKPIKCDITLKNGEPDAVECTYEYGKDQRTIWTVRRIDSSADELEADKYAELGELRELMFYGAKQNGKITSGYERLAKAVTGDGGIVVGFSIGKDDGYCFAEDRTEADWKDSFKSTEGMEVHEGDSDYRPNCYYYVTLTTGRLTTEQIWQAMETVYSNWK
ncbi:MAG: hypothetical protein HFE90_09800 [Firmicutes bacterium]|nr:hypothetical protein [Bacillota bacterium]